MKWLTHVRHPLSFSLVPPAMHLKSSWSSDTNFRHSAQPTLSRAVSSMREIPKFMIIVKGLQILKPVPGWVSRKTA